MEKSEAAKRYWNLAGLSWKEFGVRIFNETIDDDVFGHAAKLSYYFLLALFPLLLFLTTLLGLLAHHGSELRAALLRTIAPFMPDMAYQLVIATLDQISGGAGAGKISAGVLLTLWAASNGMGAIVDALNEAYEVKERRPWWKTRLMAVALTVATALFIVAALTILLWGSGFAFWITGRLGFGPAFQAFWENAQWGLVFAFVLIALSLVYRFAPNLPESRSFWINPGAFVALALWLAVSFGFRVYLMYFNSYGATYGSLGAVIVLMLWLYLTGAAILIGGEVNSELQKAAGLAPRKRDSKRPADG